MMQGAQYAKPIVVTAAILLPVSRSVADEPMSDGETYEPVTCTACGRVHLINPNAGAAAEPIVSAALYSWLTFCLMVDNAST
jgi:hypothetical protein